MSKTPSDGTSAPAAQETLSPEIFGPPIDHSDQPSDHIQDNSDTPESRLHEAMSEDIRNGTFKAGKYEIPEVGNTKLDLLRFWVRLHGPENPMRGESDVLEKSAEMLASMAPRIIEIDGRTFADQQGTYLDIASSYELAARTNEDPLDRVRLHGLALKALKEERDRARHPSQQAKAETDFRTSAYLGMLTTDIRIALALDLFEHREELTVAQAPKNETELTEHMVRLQAQDLNAFRQMVSGDTHLPIQTIAEWLRVLDARQQIIKNATYASLRARVGLPHEANPAYLGNADDREYDEMFAVAIDQRDETGNWQLTEQIDIQIGGLADDGRPLHEPAPQISRTVIELGDRGEDGFANLCHEAATAMFKELEVRMQSGEWMRLPDKPAQAIKRAQHEMAVSV